MPVLKEYADSNDSDGYYIHAPISGVSHPIPLQTPEVTEEIYRELGYQPKKKGPDGGVNVPNELTWTLYNVGLHWTKNSGPQKEPADLNLDRLRDEAGPELTKNHIETVLSYAKEYRGQYQSRVKELREQLNDDSGNHIQSESGDGVVPSSKELISEMSEKLNFDDQVERLLEDWQPNSLKPDEYEPDEYESDEDAGFSFSISTVTYTTHSEYREKLDAVANLKARLQEYEEHSWKVRTVRASNSNSDKKQKGLKITFQLNNDLDLTSWICRDYREINDDLDFKFSTGTRMQREYTFEVEDNYISDFNMWVGSYPVGKFELPPNDYWGYEVENHDPNEIMHALVSDFSNIVPVLTEFFDKFPSYNLESMEMGAHSVGLS